MKRIQQIKHTDLMAYQAAKNQWDLIAKPLGSFGLLEELIQRIAAIQGTPDVDISRRAAVVFCADHGIVAEGVTQCGSDVTAICAKAIAEGTSNINAIATEFHAEVIAVDVGMIHDAETDKILQRKVVSGTGNFTKEPAMTEEQMCHAITTGIDIAEELKASGVNIIASGEMGIGNTTAAAALASVLLDLPPAAITGRGAGLSDEGLQRKICTIQRGIALHHPSASRPFHLLQTLGGLEIAAMTGLFLGGAIYHIPVIIDGVISAAAAAVAYQIAPICGEYMLASHCSGEPAASGLLQKMHLQAVIDAGLRLGEGTGGLLLLPLLDGTLALYRHAHTFEQEHIERYTKQS
ncbi:MAG: nicotinate-nucleotide--dimethylbenzimidazole phosphoribosyltransferase [Oscillospiraceae bacterium]|nr:nicotinate-nucleotide--dimethylbenzimidazole phosphoribosyltransferase [Oscillospiraceae bacterium]